MLEKIKKFLTNNSKALIPFNEKSINIDHKRKIIFIHNPKTGGTSIKKALGMSLESADHRTPTELCSKVTWEEYFSFTVVRHPIDRFISSYQYHTGSDYKGVYYKRHPKLHDFNFKTYFEIMKNEKNAIIPQINYTFHKKSDKKIDTICKFEELKKDMDRVFYKLGICSELPHLNKSKKRVDKSSLENIDLYEELLNYYEDDFKKFNY